MIDKSRKPLNVDISSSSAAGILDEGGVFKALKSLLCINSSLDEQNGFHRQIAGIEIKNESVVHD